ncbi:DUF2934 domain-containing protein [Shinella sp. CPCC 101442]|uniref:DUF2934 domain-containing protein n=1 Tax=Shinella sp. CPCC 101442 TaxID=2932265 RepID=UPI002152E0B0|nr:DUF2934 domain-containing protein [Shinella sp. CPCC 101442]MCR6499394.1 DUF2934 domain-containing protein [Shinella sp. CPCC 101442]
MQDERQEWISKRAYSLWEASGRQHGEDHEHWEQAVRERADLEKVALPEHLRTKRNSLDADAATQKAIASRRQPRPKPSGEVPSLRP